LNKEEVMVERQGQDLAQEFVRFAVEAGVLRFGEFKTKAGRMSPYFFNAGLFDDGAKMGRLAQFYAQALVASGIEFDMLFGPAYKGIPLGATVAVELARLGRNVPFAYNRKEAKDHGEGGSLIGADMAGRRILIVDDVITAGTAIREALAIIREANGIPAGIVVALDRQEIASEEDRRSAAQAVAAETGIPVIAVANLADLLAFASGNPELVGYREPLLAYRARYGSNPTG
jgi:orotate phosphoribosyltransferase